MKIDINKKYINGKGQTVILHEIVLKNSAGDIVTYPVHGTIIIKKPRKREYAIWSIEGKANVVWPEPENDLVEVK